MTCARKRHKYLASIGILIFLAVQTSLAQQVAPSERVYNHTQVEITKALQQLKADATERLPALEGFANASAVSVDHLQNPHFQLHIDLISDGPSQTVVRVSAKITAWYEDADPSRSQYAVVPSNGRLEEDFLDRLSLYLEKGGSKRPVAPPTSSLATPASRSNTSSAEPASVATGSGSPVDVASPVGPSDPAPTSAAGLASRIASTRAEREALEQSARKLQQQISELDSASKSEVFVNNVAIARSAQTPVFEKGADTSKV